MQQVMPQQWGSARNLRGLFLLVSIGTLFGLSVPLSKLATEIEAHPVGLALWVNALTGSFCLIATVIRGRMPVFTMRLLRFVCLWGLLGSVGGDLLLFWFVQHLPASTLSIILVCEGFIVYGFVALFRSGRPSSRNLASLVLGMLGMILLLSHGTTLSSVGEPVWILLALSVPAVFAAEDLLIADSTPAAHDFLALTGLAALAGSLMLLPIAWYTNDFIALSWTPDRLELAIVCIAASTALATLLMVSLMTNMGAVYGSHSGYTITFAGVGWSCVLLGERLSLGALLAMVLLLVGLLIAEPRNPVKIRPTQGTVAPLS